MDITALIITLTVCLLMTFFILKIPVISLKVGKQINLKLNSYWIIALIAPVLLLAFGVLSTHDIYNGITADSAINPLKILILFFSMCFMSVCLDKAGFFQYCAHITLSKAQKGQKTLFTYFYFFISLLTIFTSNDIIILAFTPFICYFCKNAKISAIPYICALFVAANTWSIMLIIGNPTNIYIASALNITFIEYLSVMALPATIAGISSFFMLRVMFNKQLAHAINSVSPQDKASVRDKTAATLSLVALALCILFLSISNYIDMDMWLISLIFSVVLFIGLAVLTLFRRHKKYVNTKENNIIAQSLKGLPYALVPFLLSMICAVLALQKHGLTQLFADGFFSIAHNGASAAWLFGFASAAASNVLNNIPMSVLFTQIIQLSSGGNVAIFAAYATIIGSNIGAFLSPAGALAGIMMLSLIKDKQTGFTNISFLRYLAPIALVSLALSIGALILSINIIL